MAGHRLEAPHHMIRNLSSLHQVPYHTAMKIKETKLTESWTYHINNHHEKNNMWHFMVEYDFQQYQLLVWLAHLDRNLAVIPRANPKWWPDHRIESLIQKSWANRSLPTRKIYSVDFFNSLATAEAWARSRRDAATWDQGLNRVIPTWTMYMGRPWDTCVSRKKYDSQKGSYIEHVYAHRYT